MADLVITITLSDDDLRIVEKGAAKGTTHELLAVKILRDGRMTEEVAQMAAKLVGTRIADEIRTRSGGTDGV